MLLERTITQLDIGNIPHERALELGQLGYMQWLGGLPGSANYRVAALRALTMAAPFMENSPAVAVFCDLIVASLDSPVAALNLSLPSHHRRGGARARRGVL